MATVFARRPDGQIWSYATDYKVNNPFQPVLGAEGHRLVASGLAAAELHHSSVPLACAITGGGEVWCFPSKPIGDSTFLGAGLGPTATTSAPVRVIESDGTPLAGAAQIAGAETNGSEDGTTFCAVTGDGSIWCWGNGLTGQLGQGDFVSHNVAVQVQAAPTAAGAPSSPFSNAVQVSVGLEVTCALKVDGTVWCWGTNGAAELGGGPAQSAYPLQVPFKGSAAQTTATRLITAPLSTFCAIMRDTSVVCWGANFDFEAGTRFFDYVSPTQVDGGTAALPNPIELVGFSGFVCARTGDLRVLCWGGSASPTPSVYKDWFGTIVYNVRLPLAGSVLRMAYVDPSSGLITLGVDYAPPAWPPCGN
jgi:hypothetical protein